MPFGVQQRSDGVGDLNAAGGVGIEDLVGAATALQSLSVRREIQLVDTGVVFAELGLSFELLSNRIQIDGVITRASR